jgi:hypothetical protein
MLLEMPVGSGKTFMTISKLDFSKPPRGAVVMDDGDDEETRASIDSAWEEHEVENDPPGMTVTVDPFTGDDVYWFALDPPPGHFADCLPGEYVDNEADARAAAWGWYKRRLALAEKLYHGVWCPECGSDEAHVEAIDEKTTTQPWCTECDVEMGGVCDDIWPRCLTWTDEQVAEVEAWTGDTSQPQPTVLQEEDEL